MLFYPPYVLGAFGNDSINASSLPEIMPCFFDIGNIATQKRNKPPGTEWLISVIR